MKEVKAVIRWRCRIWVKWYFYCGCQVWRFAKSPWNESTHKIDIGRYIVGLEDRCHNLSGIIIVSNFKWVSTKYWGCAYKNWLLEDQDWGWIVCKDWARRYCYIHPNSIISIPIYYDTDRVGGIKVTDWDCFWDWDYLVRRFIWRSGWRFKKQSRIELRIISSTGSMG